MQAHVLIIEDEPKIVELISMYLRKEGIETSHALTGEEGLKTLTAEHIDLVILDINLPGIDGFEVLQEIRRIENLPVIIVSARQEDEDMILGFGIGADDYVAKPFSPRVLAARVRTILKRSRHPGANLRQMVRFGSFSLDTENCILKKDGIRMELAPKEMSLLLALSEKPGRAMSQDELYNTVWANRYGDMTTVSVHIQRLRKKIEEDPSVPVYIKTSYGFGYYLDIEGGPNES